MTEPGIYKRNCNTCGQYYEGQGKYFCSHKCKGIFLKGRKHPPRTTQSRKIISIAQKKRFGNEEERIKQSERLKGKQAKDKHWNWLGGICREPYSFEFDNNLRESIRLRDNHTCQLCNRLQEEELLRRHRILTVHHINYNKKDSQIENLITLCTRCNIKANSYRRYYEQYFVLFMLERMCQK